MKTRYFVLARWNEKMKADFYLSSDKLWSIFINNGKVFTEKETSTFEKENDSYWIELPQIPV